MNRPPAPDDSPDEPARDAWLREALRHAPDADAAPSVAVRETILRQARAEAATAPATPRPVGAWQRFSAAWSWLSGPRVAAAFASVMVATVIGLIWWDRPIDETLRPVEPPTTVAAPTPAAEPAPTPAPSPPAPSAEPPRDLAAAAPPRTVPERKRETVRPRAEASNDARLEAKPSPPAAPRADDEARALADAAESAADTAADSARADKESKEIDTARERRAETVAQAKSAAPAMRSAPAAAAGTMHAPAPAAAPAPPSPPVASAESRKARAAPLGALLEALAEETPRWRWQRDGGAERALTPELQAWLQRLDRAVAGRWSAAEPGQGSGQAQVQAPAQELRLLRDGGVEAIVRFGTDGRVRIDIAGEGPITAQLPAAIASALRRGLDDANR